MEFYGYFKRGRTMFEPARNKKRGLPIQPMNNNRYSTAYFNLMAINDYLLAVFSVITFS